MSQQTEVYKESDTHIPEVTDQTGTLDTSGTAGAAHQKLEEVTKVFEAADAQVAMVAADAIDPEKPDVWEGLVTLPPETVDPNEVREKIRTRADGFRENPVVIGGPTPAQRQAAEEGTGVAEEAEGQRTDQGGTSAGGRPEPVAPGVAEGLSLGDSTPQQEQDAGGGQGGGSTQEQQGAQQSQSEGSAQQARQSAPGPQQQAPPQQRQGQAGAQQGGGGGRPTQS